MIGPFLKAVQESANFYNTLCVILMGTTNRGVHLCFREQYGTMVIEIPPSSERRLKSGLCV